MCLKELLGLKNFPIRDSEIIRRINEAKLKKLKEVVFSSDKKEVRIKLSYTATEGLMRNDHEYFNAK